MEVNTKYLERPRENFNDKGSGVFVRKLQYLTATKCIPTTDVF